MLEEYKPELLLEDKHSRKLGVERTHLIFQYYNFHLIPLFSLHCSNPLHSVLIPHSCLQKYLVPLFLSLSRVCQGFPTLPQPSLKLQLSLVKLDNSHLSDLWLPKFCSHLLSAEVFYVLYLYETQLPLFLYFHFGWVWERAEVNANIHS